MGHAAVDSRHERARPAPRGARAGAAVQVELTTRKAYLGGSADFTAERLQEAAELLADNWSDESGPSGAWRRGARSHSCCADSGERRAGPANKILEGALAAMNEPPGLGGRAGGRLCGRLPMTFDTPGGLHQRQLRAIPLR
jgi:hypothetical protein